jgi:hypothetical protein
VQHFEVDGVPYRMTVDFFTASLGRRESANSEYELQWIDPNNDRWYHASHRWAAQLQ